MKMLLSLILAFASVSAFAYPNWHDYTPSNVIADTNLFGTVVVHTSGTVNSCSDIFERNKFDVKVIGCQDGALALNIQYKNKASCDQGMRLTKKFRVKLSKKCRDEWINTIVINGKSYKY